MCTECDVQDFKEHVDTVGRGRARHRRDTQIGMHAIGWYLRGYMCRMCQFGPMWHAYCDDLRAHHNDDVDGTPISNACPECGHLESSTSMLLAWSVLYEM